MKPWERVVKAMQHAVPDRVPLYEMHIPPKVASVILGKDPSQVALHNPEVFFRLAAEKRVNLDRINKQVADELVSLYVKLGIDWIRVVGAYIYVPRGVKRLGEREWLVDGRLLVWSGETLWDPQMLWDAGGVLDADSLLRYCRSAKPEVDPKVFDVLREVAKRVKGELFLSFDADGTWGPIVSSPPLLKKVLIWVYKRPDVVKALIDYYTRIAITYGEYAIDEGADAIQLCVDYGNKNGPWLSPQMFEKFVKPALARHVNAFKRKGAFVVLHSDGNIAPLIPHIVDAGVDTYQGIDVMAGMSLAEVKRKYGDKLCLVGNVDPRVIEFGTLEDVEREVDRCLREGGKEGYVLSASANISVCTNARNFIHMIEYAKKRGVFST
jgi:hypothetical protein